MGEPGFGDAQRRMATELPCHTGARLPPRDAGAVPHHTLPSSFFPRDASPGQVCLEDRLPGEVVQELARRGHQVAQFGPWELGRLSVVAKEGSTLRAAANPRGAQGYAVGR
jgi:gamma-glutamyltranspeptidase / glutathione hydrolase